jgi:hypothetical protein
VCIKYASIFELRGHQKITQIWIFVLKIYHLATLMGTYAWL